MRRVWFGVRWAQRWKGINKNKYNIECRNVWWESRLDFFIDKVRGIMLDGQIFRSLFWAVDQRACKTSWIEDLSHVVSNESGLECGEDGGSLRVTVVLVRMCFGDRPPVDGVQKHSIQGRSKCNWIRKELSKKKMALGMLNLHHTWKLNKILF